MHHTVVHNGVPVMDIAVDIMRTIAAHPSEENEATSRSESSEELEQTPAVTQSSESIG
jgi:hypothetical protein